MSRQARAVLVDMEEGVVNDLLRGTIGAPQRSAPATPPPSSALIPCPRPSSTGDCFDPAQLISGISGSGNNWACGAHHYGTRPC